MVDFVLVLYYAGNRDDLRVILVKFALCALMIIM